MQGKKVGYGQNVVRTEEENGHKVVHLEVANRLTITRKSESIDQQSRIHSWETPDGKLLRFTTDMYLGSSPRVIEGRVENDQIILKTTTKGVSDAGTVPWSKEWGGIQATEQSLTKQPMQPGEKRKIKQFEGAFASVVDVELKAIQIEPTPLLDHTEDLLRIEGTQTMPNGQAMQQVLWTNRSGEILKSRLEAFNTEIFRCSKEIALSKNSSAQFDLILNNWVKPDRPIEKPHSTKRIRYLIQIEGGDPAKSFVAGPTQQLKTLGPGMAELTVRALRPEPNKEPEKNANKAAATEAANPEPQPTDDDRSPNNLIQSDDKKVVELAKQGAGDETDTWKVACKLEQFVNRYITKKNFSQGFASAAEVAENPEGDCTEHSVLLAGLARARGIPARCCIGLVYVEGNGFGYHMWTEVWIKDGWFPLDATLGRGGIGAAHLKLASTNLKGASALSAFLPVAHVMGRLKVKILEVE